MGVGDRRIALRARRRRAAGRLRHRFGRTLLVGALSIGLTVGATVVAGPPANADGDTFSNGRATAVSQVVRVAPGVGSLSLAVAAGVAITNFSNSLAQAQAQSVDLGLIGGTLTGEQCDGSAPVLKASDLPQPLQVDNRKGDAANSGDEYPIAGSALGLAHQEVAANVTPQAFSSVSAVHSELGPVATISGGRSDASSGVVDGNARQAEASVSVDLDLLGAVHLKGLTWRAVHRTGANAAADGSFTIASGDVGDLPLTVDDLKPLETTLNTLLASTGLSISLPHIERLTEPNDLIRVTPLRLVLRDSQVGKQAFGPVLNLTRVQREQLFDQILGLDCRLASGLLVGDITLDTLSGTGFIVIDIGGVEASSSDLIEGNPFGDAEPFGSNEAPVANPPAFVPPRFATPAVAPPPPIAETAAPAARPVAATGPIEEVCETMHISGSPGCSKGMGVPIGVLGVALTGLIAYLDWRRQRRLAAAPAEVAS